MGAGLAGADRRGAPGSASPDLLCTHCGLPVPEAAREPSASQQFCCSGCRAVYAVIQGAGLGRYYSYREAAGEQGRRATPTGRGFEEFDEPAFHQLYCTSTTEGLTQAELYLEGVHCSACVWLIEKVALACSGAREARLDAGRSTVKLTFDAREAKLSELARALDAVGYRSHPQRGRRAAELRRREDRALLARMAVAGAAAGNVMLMSAALYGGAFSGMEQQYRLLFRWGSLLVSTPAVLWSASVFFRGAWGAVKARASHMDIPISIGILAGFAWGAYATALDQGDVYFDSITVLIFLLLVGRWLQRKQQHVAYAAAELLYSLAPSSARLLPREGEFRDAAREVPAESLVPGDKLEILAGGSVPVDGRIVDGYSAMDGSLLTGESRPEPVGPGSFVYAGSTNLSARLVMVADKTGEETRVAQIMKEVEAAAERRPPVVELADRISAWFVVVVLGLALVTVGLWLFIDSSRAVEHAVALLVVSCPCALGMATPLAVSVALGRAARAGLLIKGGEVIELVARPGLIVFDKTGTLTQGRLELVSYEGDESLKPHIRAIESHSAHPVARAFSRAIPEPVEGGAPAHCGHVEHVEHRVGAGVAARVDGRELLVGSPVFVLGAATAAPWVDAAVQRATRRALSPVLVAVDGAVEVVAGLGDPLRAEAKPSLDELRRLGYRLRVLSGDHQAVVDAVANALGGLLEAAQGGASPEEKLRVIEAAAREGSVLMVGDGVNDAAALSAASVGVAVHGGAEASLAAAHVFATREGIEPVLALVRGARRAMRTVRRNLVFSLAYNAVGVALAMAGVIGPLLAALLMPLSSLTVLTSSFRARSFDASP